MKMKYDEAFAELVEIADDFHAKCVIGLVDSQDEDGKVCPVKLEQAYQLHAKINEILKTADYLHEAKKRHGQPEGVTEGIAFGRDRRR